MDPFLNFDSATSEVRYNILQFVGPLYFTIYDGNLDSTKMPSTGHKTCPSRYADILSLQIRNKAARAIGGQASHFGPLRHNLLNLYSLLLRKVGRFTTSIYKKNIHKMSGSFKNVDM